MVLVVEGGGPSDVAAQAPLALVRAPADFVVFPPSLNPDPFTISSQSTARHPSPFKRQSKSPPPCSRHQHVPRGGEYRATVSSPIPLLTSKKDSYYGYEDTANLSARFVTHLVACPGLPPLLKTVTPSPSPPLANFIAYGSTSVTFAALGMSALREINHTERSHLERS